jgi:hypothetical protein
MMASSSQPRIPRICSSATMTSRGVGRRLVNRRKRITDLGFGERRPGLSRLLRRVAGQVGQRQHAYEPIFFIEHRQAPDACASHQFLRDTHRIAWPAGENLLRHGFGGVEISEWLFVEKCAHADVPIGNEAHYAHGAIPAYDRQASAVVIPKELCDILEGVLGTAESARLAS